MNSNINPGRFQVGTRADFNEGLSELQANGATALVTGTGDEVAFHRISGHLLGNIEESRIPLFALIARDTSLIKYRSQHPAAINEFQIIEYMRDLVDSYETRGPTFLNPDSGHENGSENDDDQDELASLEDSIEQTDLQTLYTEIEDAVDSIQQRYQIDDWDLRIAIDSCIPLLEYNELDSCIAFFENIRQLTVKHTGLTHAIYPIAISSEGTATVDTSVDNLLESFDIHIRVRSQDTHETQWELLEYDVRTDWLKLPPADQGLP
jgi:hypothetical protein